MKASLTSVAAVGLLVAVTWIIKGLLRAGIPMGPMILLTVRGRTSGKPRTTPVDLFERGGRSFCVWTPPALANQFQLPRSRLSRPGRKRNHYRELRRPKFESAAFWESVARQATSDVMGRPCHGWGAAAPIFPSREGSIGSVPTTDAGNPGCASDLTG